MNINAFLQYTLGEIKQILPEVGSVLVKPRWETEAEEGEAVHLAEEFTRVLQKVEELYPIPLPRQGYDVTGIERYLFVNKYVRTITLRPETRSAGWIQVQERGGFFHSPPD
jgi:hypothetical protein